MADIIRSDNRIGNLRTVSFTRPGEYTPYYVQTIVYDDVSGFTRAWLDTNMQHEAFTITQTGVNKKGDPVYEVECDHSTIVLCINGVKFQSKEAYDAEMMRLDLQALEAEQETWT